MLAKNKYDVFIYDYCKLSSKRNSRARENVQKSVFRFVQKSFFPLCPNKKMPHSIHINAQSLDNEHEQISLSTPKKSLKSYTVAEKLKAIRILEQSGPSAVQAKGIPISNVYKWKKKKNILQLTCNNKYGKKKRKLSKGARTVFSKELEEILYQKVMNLRRAMIPVNNKMLKIFAMQMAAEQNLLNFKCSDCWVERFKKRFNLVLRKGTKRSPKISDGLLQKLQVMQRDVYNLILTEQFDYLLNVDETPIYYNMTFDHTLATAGSEEVLIRRTEQDKKRLTLAAGVLKPLNEHVPKVYKCKPFIIFKGKTPRTLSSISETNRIDNSIVLRYQEKGWMNTELYIDYLNSCIPEEAKGKKILLVQDNFEAHLALSVFEKARENNITIYNLPANATFVAQPLDVCINRPIKNELRRLFNEFLVTSRWNGESFDSVSKDHMVNWIREAWSNIQSDLIVKSFSVCGLGVHPFDNEQTIYWKRLNSLQSQLGQVALPSVRSLIDNGIPLFDDNYMTPTTNVYIRYPNLSQTQN